MRKWITNSNAREGVDDAVTERFMRYLYKDTMERDGWYMQKYESVNDFEGFIDYCFRIGFLIKEVK